MIPQKLIIEGFLCYRTPQEIDLSDLPLCMLSGPNGSGKSTVFDAITFALFGTHRGGALYAEDLINKKCDTASVVYEFLLDGKPWRIYRTISKTVRGARKTGHVCRPSSKGDGEEWDIVPDTHTSTGLDNWVAAKLVLSGKAFTRSMLLRQGESDRLLSSEPKERFEVLAGIAELEKYQELEASAVARKGSTAEEVKRLASQLAGVTPVSEEQLDEAAKETQAAAERLREADEIIAGLQEQQVHATHWADLKVRLDQAKQKRSDAAGLVKNADQIEADHQQLTVLSTVLPQLEKISSRQKSIAESKARVDASAGQRAQKLRTVDAANSQAKRSQEECSAAEVLIPELEAHQSVLARNVAESRRTLDAAEATVTLRTKLAETTDQLGKVEKKHPHPDVQLRQARLDTERLTAIAAALPTLERFSDSRKNGIDAAARRTEADAGNRKCAIDAKNLAAQCEGADRDIATAETANQQAQQRETEIATLLKHAKAARADLDNADGKAECPTCGQALTAAHLSAERARRNDEVARLTAEKSTATVARQSAESNIKELRRARVDLNSRQQELTAQIQKLTATISQAEQESARTARECRRAYDTLPDEWRTKISPDLLEDWSQTRWPAIEDFDALRGEAKQRATAVEQVSLLDKIASQWRDLTTQAQTMRAALAAQMVAVSDDLPAQRANHTRLETDQTNTGKRLAAARETLRVEQQTLKRLCIEIKQLEAEISKLGNQADIEQAYQKSDEDAIQNIVSQLPPDWAKRVEDLSEAFLKKWKAKAGELQGRGVAEAFKGLSEARTILATIDARIAELDADIAKIPEPARQAPELLAAHLQQSRTRRTLHETARQAAQTRHGELQAARRLRAELEQSQRAADRRLRHLDALCKLLGRNQLQRHLVRQIEHKIVERGNVILYKLSAGNLRLQLREHDPSDTSDPALDLVAIHQSTGGPEPIAVAFLSGSQRFRVAVSLALAIGQVAGNTRCGECVIIDEGFGSLDREGQDVMIQELKHLQGIMKRIILVSHQESFADAFPHGYRFAIHDGEARVERMNG